MILPLLDHKADIFDQPSASVLLSGWIQKTDSKRRMPFRKQSSLNLGINKIAGIPYM